MSVRSRGARILIGWGERLRIFLLFTSALLALELAHNVYRLYAFAEERTQLRVLGPMVSAAGVEVIRTQLAADSLRERIEAEDQALEASRDLFETVGERVTSGRIAGDAYASYRRQVAGYNLRVAERNVRFAEWQRAISRNRDAVKRYNGISEEIRRIAARMGEQHYNIPSPVEAAVQGGLK